MALLSELYLSVGAGLINSAIGENKAAAFSVVIIRIVMALKFAATIYNLHTWKDAES